MKAVPLFAFFFLGVFVGFMIMDQRRFWGWWIAAFAFAVFILAGYILASPGPIK